MTLSHYRQGLSWTMRHAPSKRPCGHTVCPLQDRHWRANWRSASLYVPVLCSLVSTVFRRRVVLGAPLGPRPLQDREVSVRCSMCARIFVPGAPLGPRPLEDREVPPPGSIAAHPFVPGAPLGPRPLEDREVPVPCSTRAHAFAPGAPLGPRPLEDRKVPVLRSPCARPCNP